MNVDVVDFALAASCFTALASVAQRRAAERAPVERSFELGLVGYLLRRPLWFAGIAAMIAGFVLQIAALRHGDLSVVQPVISTELVIVFACIALLYRRKVSAREWLAALGMVVGLAAFLAIARPSGGSAHASGLHWVLAAFSVAAAMGVAVVCAFVSRAKATSPPRRAAFLAIAAAIGFGFVAAVVKELSTHLHQGASGVFSSWSPYVLVISGALSMYLATNAFQVGPLLASKPGLTLVDPIVASALGVVLFGEHLDVTPLAALGEVCAVGLIAVSVIALSRSPLIRDDPSKVAEVHREAETTSSDSKRRARDGRRPDFDVEVRAR